MIDPAEVFTLENPQNQYPVYFPSATETHAGMMSAADKAKLDGLSPGGGDTQNSVESYVTGSPLIIAVTFLTPMSSANYTPQLTPGDSVGGPPPPVWWSDRTQNGFNINIQADPGYNFSIGWSAKPNTQ